MSENVQKIIITTATVIAVPIVLYFLLGQAIYDMADDIAVKNGDDCRLLDEEDLKILSKEQYEDARKYFEVSKCGNYGKRHQ